MTRIAIYCEDGSWGGVVAYAVALARGLPAEGFDPVLLAPRPFPWHERALAQGIRVVPLTHPPLPPAADAPAPPSQAVRTAPPFRAWRWYLGAVGEERELRRLFRTVDADLIHVQSCGGEVAPLAARRAGRGRPVVSSFHITPDYVAAERRRNWWYRRMQSRCMLAIDRGIAVCRAARDEWITELGRAGFGDRVDVVYNGVPPSGALPSREAARAELGLDDTAFVWLNVAALLPYKGHQVILDAAVALAETTPHFTLLLAGGGPLERDLAARIGALGLAPRVRLLGHRGDVDRLAAAADAYVQPSLREAFPMVLLEMGAHGLAVVATATGGVPELITDGVHGLLVPPGDAAALAGAMRRVMSEPERRATLAAALHDRVAAEFREDQMVAATAAVYRRALARA